MQENQLYEKHDCQNTVAMETSDLYLGPRHVLTKSQSLVAFASKSKKLLTLKDSAETHSPFLPRQAEFTRLSPNAYDLHEYSLYPRVCWEPSGPPRGSGIKTESLCEVRIVYQWPTSGIYQNPPSPNRYPKQTRYQ